MSDPRYAIPILALIVLGVAFRYALALIQATRQIGIAIASPELVAVNKTGLQDAVTPPQSSKLFFVEIALILALVVWLWSMFGLMHGIVGALAFFVSGVVAGSTFLPRPNSRHFVTCIFGSMSRRYADYERDGDKQRAMAMRMLLEKFVAQYGGVVGSPDKASR
jgi:uncharacterized membrane protein YgcG